MDGWRSFAVRHALGRFRIGPDIVRHLSTFQRLGATMDATPPTDMLHVGARAVFRAVRSRSVVDISPEWLWPRWLADQLDPSSPAFTPRGHLPVIQNVTQRNWTMVGNLGSAWEATIDTSGLVTPTFDGWSVDWWAAVDGQWRFPSRAAGVEQALVGSAPVVRTVLPLNGGAIVAWVYAVETVPEVVVCELENAADEEAEVAFALRPYNPEGLAVIEEIRVDGDVVHVDGEAVLALPGPPARTLLSGLEGGDVANLLAAGGPTDERTEVRCRAGLAHGAFVYPLAPGAHVRLAMPISGRAPRPRVRLPWRLRTRARLPRPGPMPGPETVADEWRQRMDRGMRVNLPDERLQQLVDANRAYLLLLHDPGSITAGPAIYHRFWFRDAAYQIAALDRWGFHDEAADVLASYPDRQQPDGFFYSQWREWDANGAAIWTIAEHHRLTGDTSLLETLAPAVAKGARWIVETCARDRGKAPEAAGLLPPGISAEHFGPYDYYYWDDFWAWRGLLDAAAVGDWTGDQALARGARAGAERLGHVLMRSIERSARRAGRAVITAGPTRGIDAGMIGGLAACWPLGLFDADDPWIAETAEAIRERYTMGPAFFQEIAHTGLGTYLTLQLAFVELLRGDPRAWERLEWLVEAATPTGTWPEAIHPQLPGGCMGDGHHGWMAADFLSFVRTVLVHDADDGVAVLSLLPDAWRGRPLAVEDAPTHHGLVSFELGWDGDEALLTWRSERPGVRLCAPALDAGWETTEQEGKVGLTVR